MSPQDATGRPEGTATQEVRTILFLCPHNAAKSVLAAAYCERAARDRRLKLHVASAGTAPADGVHPVVIQALREEGIDVSGYRPRRATREEMATAWRIISLGCELGDLAGGAAVERWDDVPAPGDDVGGACSAIRQHMALLINELEQEHGAAGATKPEA